MVKANDYWFNSQHSAWQQPLLNCMSTSLVPRQPECLPPGTCMSSAHMALPGFRVPGVASLKADETDEAHGLLQHFPPHFQTLLPSPNLCLEEKKSALSYGLSVKAVPTAIPGSFHKRFLIFDQSGNQTRLIYDSVCPPIQNLTVAASEFGYDLHKEKQAVKREQFYPTKPILPEKSDDNHEIGEESEMHEDTKEINALLYSDDDDDDDEVTSTGRSPIAIKGGYEKQEQLVEITEEVASSGGPNKRHKLFNGGFNKSSLMNTANSVKLDRCHNYDNDAESIYATGKIEVKESGPIFGNKRSRKDEILETLKVLESIIPRVKGKDPLLVLDEAINYLKSLKLKSTTLGVDDY